MKKVELLPTRDCEAGYGPEPMINPLSATMDWTGLQKPQKIWDLKQQTVQAALVS